MSRWFEMKSAPSGLKSSGSDYVTTSVEEVSNASITGLEICSWNAATVSMAAIRSNKAAASCDPMNGSSTCCQSTACFNKPMADGTSWSR